jgi:hypothetical protein
VISERQVGLVRVLGSRIGLAVAAVFLATWLLFAIQSVRVPLLSGRIAELERDNRRIDSLQVALSRMHGRYEQVRQMLAAGSTAPTATIAAARPNVPNVTPVSVDAARSSNVPVAPPARDTTGSDAR